MKNGFVFYSKVIHLHVYEKKWNTPLQFFCFMRFSGWTYNSNRNFSIFFLWYGKDYLKHTL